MTDTPRTDGQAKLDWGELVDQAPEFVRADFARQLERELSAAKADQAAVRRHAEKMATTLDHWASIDACNCAALDAYRRDYPKERELTGNAMEGFDYPKEPT